MLRVGVVSEATAGRYERQERAAAAWWPGYGDRLALLALAAVTAVASWQVLHGGTLIGQDSATQFYPWYDYLGERLRAGDVPGWNPYQIAGAPFAADPQSGWLYLPAMVLFALLPLSQAAPAFVVFHIALAGFAVYVLARLLGLGVAGALVAGIGYQLAGPIYGRSVCCPPLLEVATWAPVVLLGAELAMRRRDWGGRTVGWIVAGLALSQVLAAWMGQGSYYVMLALAAFIAWRALLAPHVPARTIVRLKLAALHGGAILTIGFALVAAAILPRLAYIGRSNLDDGEYAGHNAWAAEIGGVTPGMAHDRVLEPTLHNPGSAVLVLALLSLLLARRWRAMPFFFIFGLIALTLATPFRTPLHEVFYTLLPRFEELHRHRPERVSVVGYIAFALLAGATADALARGAFQRRRMLIAAALPIAALALLLATGSSMPIVPVTAIAATAALLAVLCIPRLESVRSTLPVLLAVVVAADLLWSFRGVAANAPYGGYHRVDLASYFAPSGAVAYLRERTADQPGRYIGYDPGERASTDGQTVLYRNQFAEADTWSLLVNNRGTLHGLEDAQGYNPVQPRRFVEYLTILNGHPQEYHDANVYASGLTSPLLDLLNVRFIVVPATLPADRPDLQALTREYPTVYSDSQVTVLENLEALPRAWIVHDALQVGSGEALSLLADEMVDPRKTALLETSLPLLGTPQAPALEHAAIMFDHPDRLRVTTHTTAPGLLMLSETYDPDWHAYINGERAPVLLADHLLRAVPLPAGANIVELRYEPQTLQIGMVISTITAGMVVATLSTLGWRRMTVPVRQPNAPRGARPIPAGGLNSAGADGTHPLAHADPSRMSRGAIVWMHLE